MSDKQYQKPPEFERITAEDMRQRISDTALEEARKTAEKARAEDAERREAYENFMQQRFTEEDRLRFRRKAERAADRGLFEVGLLAFPAEHLEDHGRRINNGDRDWPDSLMGYARACYDAFRDLEGRDRGYRMIARVLSFPHGMIGEIGLYVSWKG